MKIVTAEQMSAIDRTVIDDMGISGEKLMESAGKKVVEESVRFLSDIKGKKRITIFAGGGNNGGDAFVVARLFLSEHKDIIANLILTVPSSRLKGDALLNYERLIDQFPDCMCFVESLDELNRLEAMIQKSHLILDGIFGTGFHGKMRDYFGEIISFINDLNKPVLSIDIPSGVNGNTGEVDKFAVRADITVTFGLPKTGILFGDGVEYTGEIKVVDIGLPKQAIDSVLSNIESIAESEIRRFFKPRKSDSNKSTFGHLLILAGSVGLTGAAVLASKAAMRAGCGMVTLGCPESLNQIFEIKLIETMTLPLPETEINTLHVDSLKTILSTIDSRKCNGVLIGPGLGKHPFTTELVAQLIKKSPCPVIIDADAINAVSKYSSDILADTKVPIILTPHPGEFSRLMDIPTAQIQKNRLETLSSFTKKNKAITILKGKNTLVAEKGSKVYVNLLGNSGLATAGTGDVLSGIIGSFLVQGMKPIEASCCGVYIHGKTADYAVNYTGERSLIASDLIKFLPDILREFP